MTRKSVGISNKERWDRIVVSALERAEEQPDDTTIRTAALAMEADRRMVTAEEKRAVITVDRIAAWGRKAKPTGRAEAVRVLLEMDSGRSGLA